MTRFRKGDRVKYKTKYGFAFGTVKCYSVGWKYPLVRVAIDKGSKILEMFADERWINEANLSLIFEAEVVNFT